MQGLSLFLLGKLVYSMISCSSGADNDVERRFITHVEAEEDPWQLVGGLLLSTLDSSHLAAEEDPWQ